MNKVLALNWWRTAWFMVILLGVGLRLFRLSWQPLWWDEGYSIYFATEPLARMLWLTARDIHPPLYYALLHFWFSVIGSTTPEAARLFSALIGIATLPVISWFSITILPKRRWLALLATVFLAVSPIHLFYSQEIRMYGLALLLTLAATTFAWRMHQKLAQGDKPYVIAASYVITASLALLTLYYSGFLLLAHQLWALFVHRHNKRQRTWFLISAILIFLLQLPWWLYAFPKLIPYIADKVRADQDVSLPIWNYLWRHWLAFFGGHIAAPQRWLDTSRYIVAALIAIPFALGIFLVKWNGDRSSSRWLLFLLLLPTFAGFAVNLAFPFFPEGGERLLLQILPYLFMLMLMLVGKFSTARPILSIILIVLPLLAAAVGNVIFFTTPRYVEHDYRPIIATIIEQSRAKDSVLAIFPWQVGYWRAYSPRTADGTLLPPQPAPVEQDAILWDEALASRLDMELEQGTIWFPMPLSFGSTLPFIIENELKIRARNLENRWYSPATRLTAWVKLEDSPQRLLTDAAYLDQVRLVSAGVAPLSVSSANSPIAVDLCWQLPTQRESLHISLRLLDKSGYAWSVRDLTPLTAYTALNPDEPCLESIAFNVPPGLPPDSYQLAINVSQDQSIQSPDSSTYSTPSITIGAIDVTEPLQDISPYRLNIQYRFPKPISDSGFLLHGYSGPTADSDLLAGDGVGLTLFLQNTAIQPSAREVYVFLIDQNQISVAGWQGWPLPKYPTDTWRQGALAQVPITFYLPPDLRPGRYTLVTGFVERASGIKSDPTLLSTVQTSRRQVSFTRPSNDLAIKSPATFGTHATLVSYEFDQEDATLNLGLTWRIQQPLLPPHHIFVHVYDADNVLIAQSDGEPVTNEGRAPSGSWLPNEYLTSRHVVLLPANAKYPLRLQMGLYLPTTDVRLPVTVDDVVIGDYIEIQLPVRP